MIAINIEMPKRCWDCPISHVDEIDYYICGEIGKNVYLYANEIHPDCPLVEIVTCKDCKYNKNGVCPNYRHFVDDDFYCADGERRE